MKSMIKSIGLNAVIFYVLFKSSVCEYIIAKLPDFIGRLHSLSQMHEALTGLILKSSRMSRRMVAVVLFVLGLWALKKIWQRLQGTDVVSQLVDKYLCDNKVIGYQICGKAGVSMPEVDRKRYFNFLTSSKRRISSVSNR